MSSYQFGVRRFNWVPQVSAWQKLQANRARMADVNARFQTNSSAANSAIFGALSTQISGSATFAAHMALSRVQAAAKAVADARTKQIDQAQSALALTQANLGTSAAPTTGTVVNSIG